MPTGRHLADQRSKACMRAVTKLLTGSAEAAAPVPPVLELASAGSVFVTDTSHRVVYVNRSAAALASPPADEILGRGCREVFRCLNCPPTCPLGSGAAMPGREVVLRGRAGGEVRFLKNVEALVDDSGALVGGLETMHDLSRLRHGATAGRAVEPATVVRLRGAVSHGMVGSSAPMRALLERIERLARVDASVLVTGESGTGKELVCRALHDAGPRAGRPFHAINCAALPEGLLESELFGHERGAFTGAVRDKPGRFEICEDGTVLLDEIGCLPYALQAKLLRVLEDGGFERVGGTRTRRLRARVIAATNTELDALVREGSFRADLLYRLKVCSLRVPPLRERADDVPALVGHFAEMLAAACGARAAGFTADAISALRAYAWPGNVRELRNVVHAALVVALDQQIDRDHLPEEITGRLERTLDAARIEEALARSRFNRSDAAAILGVSRTTLWRHMKRTGVR